MEKLIKNYESARDKVIKAFCDKHKLGSFEISNDVVVIGDYYLDFDDILYDIKFNVPKDEFFDWYNYSLDMMIDGYGAVNYKSYLMGYRFKKRSFYSEKWYRINKWLIFARLRFLNALPTKENKRRRAFMEEHLKDFKTNG